MRRWVIQCKYRRDGAQWQRAHKEELRRIAAQHRAEREARRPVCADRGTRFTDAGWKAIEPAGWDAPRETHPRLCEDCKQKAGAVVSHDGSKRARTLPRRAEHQGPPGR
ncbi:hypothetical protein [Streptomyces sp. H72]